MDRETTESLVAAVESAYPDAFRTVVHYEVEDGGAGVEDGGVDHEILRVREDVRESFSDAERERAARKMVEEAAVEAGESSWHDHLSDAGPLHFSMRVFRDVTLIHAAHESDAGGFVASVDTRVSPFVQRLVENLDAEVE